MVASRRQKDLIKSRRRVEDDGEEEGSVAAGAEEDSLSEGSVISDADDDADAEGSDGDDAVSPTPEALATQAVANGHGDQSSDPAPRPMTAPGKPMLKSTVGDTETMMNGLQISGENDDEGIDFENLGEQPEIQQSGDNTPPVQGGVSTENIAERRRREHEEYKKKRDADPAFVPTRGGFFMHDHRSAAPGQNGFIAFGRGRGRGLGRPLPPSTRQQPLGPADTTWAHDLHETIAQPDIQTAPSQAPPSGPRAQDQQIQLVSAAKLQPPNRSFNKTTRIGNVQIRVLIGGMTDPIVFSAVPVNQHTRLPHHRPPLRRDKPVRISLPEMPIRYIFPSLDRSFIFIPRALRPNQQGFGRIRGRGSFGGGYSALGGPSSRRTSAYAGSAYSPSVALSRRSSLAREVSADGNSPTGPVAQRMAPVVRLPPAALQATNQQFPIDQSMAATVNLPQTSAYPLPQKPTFRENRPTALPMHHPKPERTLQVADIDSPATLEFNPPQQQHQLPFHQQVPSQITGQAYPAEYPHSRHPSHPSQASGGTPLPQIPERTVHAQPFQPYPFQHPGGFYPQQFPPAMYYCPPPNPTTGAPSVAAPAFVPGQPYQYPIPMAPPPQQQSEPTPQTGMVAHESNGMVYYYDPSQLAENAPAFSQPSYSMPPPVVGMGDMMTPPIYYPPPYYPAQ